MLRGAPETGLELVAAKVYRPRMFRNLRNDKMYRDGRELLTADGKHGKPDDRMIRAVGKKTAYGQQVAHTSWLMYEFNHWNGCTRPEPPFRIRSPAPRTRC